MMEWISTYFVNVIAIPGGVRVDLGYVSLAILAWISWSLIKRIKRARIG